MYTTVFFDADGTLIDHKAAEKQALEHIFTEIDLPYNHTYQDVFRPLDTKLWAGGVVPLEDIPIHRFKLFFKLIGVNYTDYAKANELFKIGLVRSTALIGGALEIVEYLHSNGITLCVVTNGLV